MDIRINYDTNASNSPWAIKRLNEIKKAEEKISKIGVAADQASDDNQFKR